MSASFSRLGRDSRGATAVEFALVAPVFLVMIFGLLDAAFNFYAAANLQGIMQKAGRDFTLEDARSRQSGVEQFVAAQLGTVAPNASVSFQRAAYFDFADVGLAETWDDDNSNGICDNNELFEDYNDNGQWDSDRGESGFGGARDAVLFETTVTYPRLFPVAQFIGFPETVTLEATTVLRNQPFDSQDRSFPTGNCP